LSGGQRSDCIEQSAAMAAQYHSHIFEVVFRKSRQGPPFDVVLAECWLVSVKTKAEKPIPNVHLCRSAIDVPTAKSFVQAGK
jgi:hypothetical protein